MGILNLIPAGRSLRFYALISWVIPAILALVSCVAIFAVVTTINYRNQVNRIKDELTDKSQIVARRISGELLIGARGAVGSVSNTLKDELLLSSVEITSKSPACSGDSTEGFCIEKTTDSIIAYRKAPHVADLYYVAISKAKPTYLSYFNFKNILFSLFPVLIFFGIGLLLQRVILIRYFLRPIQALIETSRGDKEPKNYWPKEIQNISENLYQSFKERDEVIFSQIARGVIHDLKTLIHTPIVAKDLVSEKPDAGEQRTKRLENLFSTCSTQLPKIQDIIDNTLDGSREIPIKPKVSSIDETVQSAIQNLTSLFEQAKTSIEVKNEATSLLLAHDSVQLERVFTNLIKNGIEACKESDGKRVVCVSLSEQTKSFDIEIEDSGLGLNIGTNKLFQPLKSTKTHGSGLGLIVSKKIVEAHGGTLLPGASQRLRGAKFTIRLPKEHLTESYHG